MEIKEEWREMPIVGYPYMVSNLGRVGRLMKTSGRSKLPQYRRVQTRYKNGKHKELSVHRMVALAFIGKPPKGKDWVNHKDSNPRNNRTDNLEWCSPKENVQHAFLYGFRKPLKSEKAHSAKLGWDNARKMREDYSSRKFSYGDLEEKYGVTRKAVFEVIKNKSWKDKDYMPPKKALHVNQYK